MEDLGDVGVSCLGRVLEGGQILPIEMPFHADNTRTTQTYSQLIVLVRSGWSS